MRILLSLIITFGVVGSCAGAEPIKVAAAADLNYALTQLANKFEASTGTKVLLSFGASGNLYAQIKGGAPFDLFFSADEEYPKKLAAGGAIDPTTIKTYAIGHLVLWVPDNSTLDPQRLQMNLLLQPSVAKLAIANPQHAPYGRAAIAALQHYGLKELVAGKLIYGENVSQAAQFVHSGNAQAGLIALSLAKSPAMVSSGKYWEVPLDAYPELRQAVGIISASKQKKSAQAFLDYALSSQGRAVLQENGLTPPPQP